jgi:hypothetical protein
VIIAVAAGALLFVGLLALVVDVGSWYSDRIRVQTLADVGAEMTLRRFPGSPAGPSARAFVLRLFQVNGLNPHRLDLEPQTREPGLLLRVSLERPRYFSSTRGNRSVNLVVSSRATRSALGEVYLVP